VDDDAIRGSQNSSRNGNYGIQVLIEALRTVSLDLHYVTTCTPVGLDQHYRAFAVNAGGQHWYGLVRVEGAWFKLDSLRREATQVTDIAQDVRLLLDTPGVTVYVAEPEGSSVVDLGDLSSRILEPYQHYDYVDVEVEAIRERIEDVEVEAIRERLRTDRIEMEQFRDRIASIRSVRSRSRSPPRTAEKSKARSRSRARSRSSSTSSRSPRSRPVQEADVVERGTRVRFAEAERCTSTGKEPGSDVEFVGEISGRQVLLQLDSDSDLDVELSGDESLDSTDRSRKAVARIRRRRRRRRRAQALWALKFEKREPKVEQGQELGGPELRGLGPCGRESGGLESRGTVEQGQELGGPELRGLGPCGRESGGPESRGTVEQGEELGGPELRGLGPCGRESGGPESRGTPGGGLLRVEPLHSKNGERVRGIRLSNFGPSAGERCENLVAEQLRGVPVLLRDGQVYRDKRGALQHGSRDPKVQASLLKKRVVSVYARVSTKKQLGGNGITEQIDSVIRAGTERWGQLGEAWHILDVHIEAASGAKSQHKRRAWQKCLKEHDAAKALKLRHEVMVARMDRLCRDPQVFADVVERGVRLRFADFAEAETCTSTGRLIFGVLALVSRYEHELIMARTSKGLSAARNKKKQQGVEQSITPAMAATTRAVSQSATKYKRQMLQAVRHMIQMGTALTQIAKVLNAAGWLTFEVLHHNGTSRGGNPVHKAYLQKAISNSPEHEQLWDAANEARAREALDRLGQRDSGRQAEQARRRKDHELSDAARIRAWGSRKAARVRRDISKHS